MNKILARAALGFFTAFAISLSGAAMAAEEKVGTEGNFTVIVFKNGKKFDRCILHQGKGKNFLRIAENKDVYTISVPTAGQKDQDSLGIFIDGMSGIGIRITGSDKDRTWAKLDPEVVSDIKAGKKTIEVELGTVRFKWKLNKDMPGAFMILDSCVEGYLNGA